jgi:hypothetical protein
MTQAALFPCDTPAAASAMDAIGFEIGWDHAHYHLVPPADHLHAGHPVRQGWQAGQAVFGTRTLRATPAVRQWLQLRLAAWRDGHSFEDLQVTPNFIAQITGTTCPVTGEPLGEDARIERVFLGAGYAAGNLVALSPRAAQAKGACNWQQALGLAERIERGELTTAGGLSAPEWRRLGVLMSLATPLKHAEVACLPLQVLPPNRLRVLNPAQALQTLLTLQFTRPGYARHMADLAAAMPGSVARQAFQLFMHTLLARRIAAGPTADAVALRRVMEQAWLHPLVQRRWERLALSLTEAQCERIVQYAERRGLAQAGWRLLDKAAATEGWALDTQGRSVLRAGGRVAAFQPHVLGLERHAALEQGPVQLQHHLHMGLGLVDRR